METMPKMNALCLGALVIMATLLVSSEGQRFPNLIGCFEAHQNCFDEDCKKRCLTAFYDFGRKNPFSKVHVRGQCQADPNPNPYNAIDCCCFHK